MPTAKGGYFLKDGTKVPSTTTIIGRFKESGGIVNWAFTRGVTQGRAFERGELEKPPALYEERAFAADIGTAAHALVEAHIKGSPAPAFDGLSTEQMSKALAAYEAYASWERHTRLRIVATEMPMVCECHRFGGTPDAIGEIDDALCLLDWKTSNAVYGDMLIQLACYDHLWNVNNERKLTGGNHLCRFAKEEGDFSHHFFPKLTEAFRAFELMRELYEIDKGLKRRAA